MKLVTTVLVGCLLLLVPGTSGAQTFSVKPVNLSEVGQPGRYLETSAEVTNLSGSDLSIRIQKKRNDIPQGWSTSICLVNCFSPDANDIVDILPSGETAYLKVTFETTAIPGEGEVEVLMSPLSNPIENYTVVMKVNTSSTSTTDRLPLPRVLALSQSYPNPFAVVENNAVSIGFSTPKTSQITLTIYNLLGRDIRTLVNDVKPAGLYNILWDGRDNNGVPVPTGIYVYKVSNGVTTLTKRMMLTR